MSKKDRGSREIPKDDPNFDLAQKYFHEAWAHAHGLSADGWAGRVSFPEFIEGCIKAFDQVATLHVDFKTTTPVGVRCKQLDRMVTLSIRTMGKAFTAPGRIRKPEVEAALQRYSRRLKEIAERSKQRLFEQQMAATSGGQPPPWNRPAPILPSGSEEVAGEERIPAVTSETGVQTEAKSREAQTTSEPGNRVVSQPGDDESMAGQRKPPRRKPNLELSRERLDLVKRLACELATLKQDVKGFCTPEELRRRHPEFVAWKYLGTAEVKEIAAGAAFFPKAYAESIALRQFGLTSRETLKKDRSKLRKSHNQ